MSELPSRLFYIPSILNDYKSLLQGSGRSSAGGGRRSGRTSIEALSRIPRRKEAENRPSLRPLHVVSKYFLKLVISNPADILALAACDCKPIYTNGRMDNRRFPVSWREERWDFFIEVRQDLLPPPALDRPEPGSKEWLLFRTGEI